MEICNEKNLFVFTLFFLGCMGSDNRPSSTGSGTAMDGYLFGSTVFIDYDEDGIHDDDEPSAITDETTVLQPMIQVN